MEPELTDQNVTPDEPLAAEVTKDVPSKDGEWKEAAD
jgi:hypothetical protein